jgi:hypothetical protein
MVNETPVWIQRLKRVGIVVGIIIAYVAIVIAITVPMHNSADHKHDKYRAHFRSVCDELQGKATGLGNLKDNDSLCIKNHTIVYKDNYYDK